VKNTHEEQCSGEDEIKGIKAKDMNGKYMFT
jgi:hypothetical protein